MNPIKKKVRTSKDTPADAKAYSLKLLSYRSRSRKEMLNKLRIKGFCKEHIKSTLTFLENSGLINDKILASDLFNYSIKYKSLGRRGIRAFLIKRGIGRELIDETLSSHSSELEEQSARKFAERKFEVLRKYPGNVVKRRLAGMLQRRGYSISVISKVFREIDL